MNTKQRDILSTQENADNSHKQNSTLTEREQIKGTPFTLIKIPMDDVAGNYHDEWFMVMGDYRITETTKTKEEQLEKLESEKWLLIMHIAVIAVQKIYAETMEYNKTINQLKKEQQQPTYETESL